VRLDPQDPLAVQVTGAIQSGDLETLQRLLREHPDLAGASIQGRKAGSRTLLHVATDWPGFFPNAPAAVRAILAAGAEVNATTGGDKPETPLHWAASTDDVDVAEVLIDAGAALDTPGGSIGTQLDNAIGYNCWAVARLLVRRGARVERLWHAAALGRLSRLEELLAAQPTQAQINQAFWHACQGGQRRAAELLLAHAADINFAPDYAGGMTPLGAVSSLGTQRDLLATWLREHGAT
jgi:ankyrin repeat protein